MTSALNALQFDNRFSRELPGDADTQNMRREVTQACYSWVRPTPVAAPKLVAHSREVAQMLGFEVDVANASEFEQVFSGNQLLDGMQPFAMCYGGHQFGNWAGQLGDGRAINLGEVINPQGEHWTLQLKGAGPTPYSRTADGLAVLRSSLREFLCSEAMFHLGVPTTRALSLVLTGEHVVRDMFYDGRPARELGAVVCRVAPSFVRFGNFEIFASRGDHATLKLLLDTTIGQSFPHLGEPNKAAYVAFFEEVCRTTAEMIVHWMRVGFVHGVMNTDNMSILGLTIDYGPYGWLEDFNPNWTPNTTDAAHRRYRFGNQPNIGQWNLLQLANALLPIIEDAEPLRESLELYAKCFEQGWQAMMAAKLGLVAWDKSTDQSLVDDLLVVLQQSETDMTIFYRCLASISSTSAELSVEDAIAPLREAYYSPQELSSEMQARTAAWLGRYQERLRRDARPDSVRREQMDAVNPKYVLRNYLAQLAIDKADAGDFSLVHELLEVLRNPYTEQPEKEQFAAKRPEWARSRPGCSMLSCSS